MITIKKNNDGELTAISTVEFDLGTVPVKESSPDGKTHHIIAGAYVDSMIDYYEQILLDGNSNYDRETKKEFLDTYVQFKMLDVIGVSMTPLRINEDGKLEGAKEGIEVKFED